MATLGDGTQITTVQDKEIVLTASNGQHFRMKVADLAEAVRQVMSVATPENNGLMQKTGLIDLGANITYKNANELPNGYLRYQHPDDYGSRNFPFDYGCILTVNNGVVGFQISSSQDGRMAWRTKWGNFTDWRYLPL